MATATTQSHSPNSNWEQSGECSKHFPVRQSLLIAAGLYPLIGGVVTLIGWSFNLPRLTDWAGTGISMFANAAVCGSMSGAAILLLGSKNISQRRRTIIRILGLVVALVGGLTLSEHISGINLGIDTLLFNKPWGQRAAAAPMRMGPPASSSFAIIGAGLVLAVYGRRARQVASALAIFPIAIASLSLIGYCFGSDRLYTLSHLTGIAIQTSSIVSVLGIGLLAALPEHGIVSLACRDDAGGMLVRRLFLPIVATPLLLAWLQMLGKNAGLYDAGFGLSVLPLATIAMLLTLLGLTASSISRAQLAIRDREERIRSVVNHVVDGIITIDENGKVESFNTAAEKLFGYDASEVIGQNVKLLMPEPYFGQHDGYIRQYLTTGQAKIIGVGREVVGKRKNGSTFPMELAVSEFSLGQQRFFTGIVRDITERKQLEDQLRQRVQELAEADRRKSEFLATLAHELRNPLAPIRNSLHILRMTGVENLESSGLQEIMERQVSHMVRLVDDLLELSRINSGKIELRKEPVKLASVVQSAIETSKPLIEDNRHQLAVAIPPEPLIVIADPIRLSQVVANLLNNAVKYTEPGGQISLTVSRQNNDVFISVRDTGIGISAAMLPRLFGMFTQADKDHKRAQGGLGIGLALAKNLVEMHGGQIAAFSQGEGRGSEFTIRLPLAERVERKVDEINPGVDKALATGCRILAVDDNPDAVSSLAMLLSVMGHEVQTADNGPAALMAIQSFEPAVVLLDLGMPGMSGYEVAVRARSLPAGREAVLVALTGWGQAEDRQRTREAGFDHHLVKPVEVQKLKAILAEIGGNARLNQPSPST